MATVDWAERADLADRADRAEQADWAEQADRAERPKIHFLFGVGGIWACLVGMASQVPWFVLPQVLACMSVVLHYFPLISNPASV